MTAWMLWSLCMSALVGLAALALDRLASTAGFAGRFVWLGAIALAMTMPIALATRPVRATLDEGPGPGTAISSAPVMPALANAAPERLEYVTRALRSSSLAQLDPWVARIWIGSSLLLALLLARRLHRIARILTSCYEEDTEVGRVLVSRSVGPAVVGVVRQRIVVPRWALLHEKRTRGLLLRHELEHVRARDTLLLFFAELVIVVFPWNAVIWWLARRLALAIEIDCDSRVIRATSERKAYGLMLLSVAERCSTALPLAASLFAPRLNIEARIDAMTAPTRHRPLSMAITCAAIVILVVVATAWAPRPASLRADSEVQGVRAYPRPLRGNPVPRYPQRLRNEGIEGHVIVEFTVDARGVPDTATLREVESTHELFTASIRNMLPSWRYDTAGVSRLSARFLMNETLELERAGQEPPKFARDPGPLRPVIIVTVRP